MVVAAALLGLLAIGCSPALGKVSVCIWVRYGRDGGKRGERKEAKAGIACCSLRRSMRQTVHPGSESSQPERFPSLKAQS